MSSLNSLKSNVAAIMTMGMMATTVAPLLAPTPASAQLFPSRTQPTQTQTLTIPAGITIPVAYDKAEKIVVSPTETVPLTLLVAANIRNRYGTILVPAGSEIVGQLVPATGGSRFVAKELVLSNGRRQYINADSNVITRTEEVTRGSNVSTILQGAAVGSGAAAIISGVTGNKKITAGKVLIGTAAGTVGGLLLGRRKTEVVVINPDTDLDLRLRSELALR